MLLVQGAKSHQFQSQDKAADIVNLANFDGIKQVKLELASYRQQD